MTDTNHERDTQQRTGPDHYEHTFDPTTETVSQELIMAVAAVTNADPTGLTPLADTLDPDGLDALFSPPGDGQRPFTEGHIAFEYEGFHVRITADGTISLESSQIHVDNGLDSGKGWDLDGSSFEN